MLCGKNRPRPWKKEELLPSLNLKSQLSKMVRGHMRRKPEVSDRIKFGRTPPAFFFIPPEVSDRILSNKIFFSEFTSVISIWSDVPQKSWRLIPHLYSLNLNVFVLGVNTIFSINQILNPYQYLFNSNI